MELILTWNMNISTESTGIAWTRKNTKSITQVQYGTHNGMDSIRTTQIIQEEEL